MSKQIRIFIEYRVKPSFIQKYEDYMESVLESLPTFGAMKVEWYRKGEGTYMETFLLPTIAHFSALRKLRGGKVNPRFGKLDQFMEGGIGNIQMRAINVK